MPIQFDKFEQSKVDRLKNHLVSMAAKGQAKFYEVFVDNLKAVPKTDEPSEFESYEDYMTADSHQIKIVIYNSATTHRNDQFVFLLKAKDRQEATEIGLNGFSEASYSQNDISAWRQKISHRNNEQREISELKKEIQELNGVIAEQDKQLDEFADAIAEAKRNGNKIGGFDVSELLSGALEGIVRRNTHLLAKVPMMEGLAGIIDEDTKKQNAPKEPQQQGEAEFRKKGASEGTLSEDEKLFMEFFKEMREHFSEDEIGKVFEILDNLSKDKSKLSVVVDLLQEK